MFRGREDPGDFPTAKSDGRHGLAHNYTSLGSKRSQCVFDIIDFVTQMISADSFFQIAIHGRFVVQRADEFDARLLMTGVGQKADPHFLNRVFHRFGKEAKSHHLRIKIDAWLQVWHGDSHVVQCESRSDEWIGNLRHCAL